MFEYFIVAIQNLLGSFQDINLLNKMQASRKTNESKKEVGRWAADEHQRFMAAIATYGKDWKKVEEIVGTRSGSQVRSHAQKFFNKLLKEQSQKKSGDTKGKNPQESYEHEGEQSQNSFMKDLHDDASNITPVQLVALIRGESQKDGNNKINIKNFQKKLKENLEVIEEQNNEEQLLENLKRQKSYKSMNNILEAYQTVKEPGKNTELQNQSFLMGLAKHYKKYFSKGGCFENLIDFGNASEVEHFEKTIRKRSFTLPEGVEGDEQDLNERKKRVTELASSKMTEKEKQSFKQAVLQSREQKQNDNNTNNPLPEKKQ